jgi:predicted nucleic acid-binding protein
VVIVDTSVWIDFFKDVDTSETVWLENALRRERIGLTTLVLCEVLQGVRSNAQFNDFAFDLVQFEVFEADSVALVIQSAQNCRTLRHMGWTIRKTINCIIATFCIENGHRLLHNDRDFDAFERHLGLQVVKP